MPGIEGRAIALDRLRALPRLGDGPGLHRMTALREALTGGGEPVEPIPPAVRITGSNGKGTVAHLTAALLRDLGLSVGLYTSPHFLRFEERFQVDGEPLPREELEDAAGRVLEAVEGYAASHPDDRVSGFEALTAMAWDLFRRRRLDAIIAEAGIGGRFDSTRIFPGEVSALSSLELEHTELLGPESLDIAYDKADLCPDGGVMVRGELDGEIARRLAGALALRGARFRPLGEEMSWEVREVSPDGMRVEIASRDGSIDLRDLELALVGRHQALNAALAVQLVREWLERCPSGDVLRAQLPDAIRRVFSRVRVPGRFQQLDAAALWRELDSGAGPGVWVDVAHTAASVSALAATVREALPGRPLVLVVGVSRGRGPKMLAPLLRQAAGGVCAVSRYRGEPSESLRATARRCAPGLPLEIAGPVEEGLAVAREMAARLASDPVVLVAGSYFLAAEAAALAAGEDPERLGFAGAV
jgi:dihydrofolate synthase/folylpolyglutamate synthase